MNLKIGDKFVIKDSHLSDLISSHWNGSIGTVLTIYNNAVYSGYHYDLSFIVKESGLSAMLNYESVEMRVL